jgi:hypothetical protein
LDRRLRSGTLNFNRSWPVNERIEAASTHSTRGKFFGGRELAQIVEIGFDTGHLGAVQDAPQFLDGRLAIDAGYDDLRKQWIIVGGDFRPILDPCFDPGFGRELRASERAR